MSRTGDWIATSSGRQFFLIDPDPADVSIDDIAHALSLVNRFGGHTSDQYSVAQHCVHVYDLVRLAYPTNYYLQFLALLHDASEAYLGDVVRPLKYAMPNYMEYEAKVTEVVLAAFGLRPPTKEELAIVKKFDDIMLVTERRDLINHQNREFSKLSDVKPRDEKIQLWHWSDAKYQFLLRFYLVSAYEKEHRQKAA
jgi:5'-deoxynucleotidase YfbR-like HD superfamily hydrolase